MLEGERRVLSLADAGQASLELLARMEAAHGVFQSGEDRFSEAGDFSGFTSLHALHAIGELMGSVVSPTAYRLHEIVNLREAYNSRGTDPSEDAEPGYGGFGMRRPQPRGIEPRLEPSELALAESNAVKIAENRLNFPSIVNTTYQGAVFLYRYYQRRFVGIEQPTGRLFQPAPDELEPPNILASVVTCAKIELVAGSPMLTDVLLDMMAHVPRRYSKPKHGAGKKKKGKKKEEEKFVDAFELERAAGILAELADPVCMEYMRNPTVFFDKVAGLYSDFYTVAARTREPVNVVLDYLSRSGSIQINRRKLEAAVPNPAPMLARMRGINFNAIRPTEDDLKSRSDSERRYFAARKKLVCHLHEALEAISQVPEAMRHERAKAAIEKAIGLKEAMEQAQKTSRTRVMEKDTKDRNEFYVGSNGDRGEFSFVREAAPKIRMKDVYGASFDDMKAHVEDLAVYSRFPRLYRATAPRGKIRSNLVAIGPYGCGKTEIGRAIGGDPRFIGAEVNVTTALTCMFGEFEKNVDRIWDGAAALRAASGGEKLVFLLMDEFDGWFNISNGHWVDETYRRVQKAIQMKLDGIVDYEGIITVGFTNEPAKIPLAIYRRFKYVDIVGELNQEERSSLLRHFLTSGLPLSRGFTEAHWKGWGARLEGATGDVIGKVADDVHYELMRDFIAKHPKDARQIESLIRKRELSGDKDRGIKSETKRLIAVHASVTPDWVGRVLTSKLAEPTIREQVATAKRVYAEARDVMRKLHMRKDAASGSRQRRAAGSPLGKKVLN